MKHYLRSFGILATCSWGTTGWANDIPVDNADMSFYEVHGAQAQNLVGGDIIPRRSDWYFFDAESLPLLHFAEHNDEASNERLFSASLTVLGPDALQATTVDIG